MRTADGELSPRFIGLKPNRLQSSELVIDQNGRLHTIRVYVSSAIQIGSIYFTPEAWGYILAEVERQSQPARRASSDADAST